MRRFTLVLGLGAGLAACSTDLADGVSARPLADGSYLLQTEDVYWERAAISTGWNQLRASAAKLCPSGYDILNREEEHFQRTCRLPCSRVGSIPKMTVRCTGS